MGQFRSLLWFRRRKLDALRLRSVYWRDKLRCVNAAQMQELERRVEVSSNKSNERRIRVRSLKRDPPDIKKLSRALIALAMAQAQAEADAQAEHQTKRAKGDKSRAA